MITNTFCGSNVVVEIDGMSVLECCGLAYDAQESKAPIYGYSSRHFDAFARGQVIVQGNLLVNYVHHDYLYRLIQVAKRSISNPRIHALQDPSIPRDFAGADISETVLNSLRADFNDEQALIDGLKGQFWDRTAEPSGASTISIGRNVFDLGASVSIKATFGERSEANGFSGRTSYILADVQFVGRGDQIQIDETTLVERYSFFARDVYTVTPQNLTTVEFNEDGDPTFTLTD